MSGVSAYDPFENIEKIDDPDVKYIYSKRKILQDLGIKYVGQLFFVNPEEVSGIDADKYEKSLIKLRKYLTNVPGFGVDAYTLLKQSEKIVKYIHTGSIALDYILGGGIRTGIITELAGQYRSGKTQVSLTTSVAVQLPPPPVKTEYVIDLDSCSVVNKNTGEKSSFLDPLDSIGRGLGRGAIYIDTEAAFEPLRLKPIAERFGLDYKKVLENITVFRVSSVREQFEAAYMAGLKVPEINAGLVVVDSLMNLFRAEYAGREQLASRQQAVNKFVHILARIAEVYNVAVIVTNQVMATPEARFAVGDAYGVKVVGGHVVAHNVGVRVMFDTTSGSPQRSDSGITMRKAKIVDSSYLPQRECRFGIGDQGVVDVDLKATCSQMRNDILSLGYLLGKMDRLVVPPSEKTLKRLEASKKSAATRKAKKLAESANDEQK